MKLFLAALLLVGLALLGMTIGVLLGGRRLRGSCGGLSAVLQEDGSKVCGICGQEVGACEEVAPVGSGPPA